MAGNAGLNPSQLANAQLIISIGKQRGESARNIEIAMMTALTESGLQMYANSNVPSSLSYPHSAVGHDHNSLGIFQQQTPGWGTVAELMNPATNVNKFYDALDRAGTGGLTEWAAAQKVQVSAYADGSNYKTQLPRAQGIMQALYGSTPSGNGAAGPSPDINNAVNVTTSAPSWLDSLGTITGELSQPGFWIRFGLVSLGLALLGIAAIKLLSSTKAGQQAISTTKTVAKSAAAAAAL